MNIGLNIHIGGFSQTGKKLSVPGDICTSRTQVRGLDGSFIEPGLQFPEGKAIGEKIKNGVSSIFNGSGTEIAGFEKIFVAMHAMNAFGMNTDYPKLFVDGFRSKLDEFQEIKSKEVVDMALDTKKNIDAVLISFVKPYSEENPKGTHIFYGAREAKDKVEKSFLLCDADRKKIIDLLVFDSPSSKLLGLSFIGTTFQFIDFVSKKNDNSLISVLNGFFKKYLGEDYDKILEFLAKYPLNGKLGEGQESMNEIGQRGKLNGVINELSSSINFAKLSYISGVISELYLFLSMNYLRKNKEEVLNSSGDRVLLDYETIIGEMGRGADDIDSDCFPFLLNIMEKLQFKEFEELVSNNYEQGNKKINGIFFENKNILTDMEGSQIISEINYEFNPTEENFDILGNDKVGGHFGVIPFIFIESTAINSGLIKKNEDISFTKMISSLWPGDNFSMKREGNEIIVYNTNEPSKIFTKINIEETKKPEEIIPINKQAESNLIIFNSAYELKNKIIESGLVTDNVEILEIKKLVNYSHYKKYPYKIKINKKGEIVFYIDNYNHVLDAGGNKIPEVELMKVKLGLKMKRKVAEYNEKGLPHGRGWIEKFSLDTIPEDIFGLGIDPKISIKEYVGFMIANKYFINPNKDDLKELSKVYEKATGFGNLRGQFSKISVSNPCENFNEKVLNKKLGIIITKAEMTRAGFFAIEVDVMVQDERLITLNYAIM